MEKSEFSMILRGFYVARNWFLSGNPLKTLMQLVWVKHGTSNVNLKLKFYVCKVGFKENLKIIHIVSEKKTVKSILKSFWTSLVS